MRLPKAVFIAFSLCLLVVVDVAAQAPASKLKKAIKATITDITPSFVMSGDANTLVITGKNLRDLKGCRVVPTVGKTAATDCSVQQIEGGKQLQVSFTPPNGIRLPQNLILSLCLDADQCSGTKEAIVITFIPATIGPADSSSGNQVSGSSSTPGAGTSPYAECINSSATSNLMLTTKSSNPANVNCASSLLTDTEVSDGFGGHVSRTYFAIQVRLSNQNPAYDFLLRDILLTLPDGRIVSGRIRRFAQGVALKGKTRDIRASVYNSLQAGTGLYGGLAIFASTGFKTVGNVLQGSFLSGYAQIFPDYTAENVNRFNTAVFDDQNPSIVPKDSIGQPPLYVVALVPKTKTGNTAGFGQRIGVGIEGTFIKQVSLVSIAPSSLDFGPELIWPTTLSSSYGTDATALQSITLAGSAQNERKVTISNNNSSPMNVSKLEILATGGKKSPDFDFDVETSECGRTSVTTDFSANDKFTIAPQSFCVVYVLFHPTTMDKSTATLVVDGDNLDGSKTVPLTGSTTGLTLLPAKLSTGGPIAPTTCSLGHGCKLNVGSYAGTVTLPVVMPTTQGGTASLTVKQDGSTAITPTGAGCVGTPFDTLNTQIPLTCTIPIVLDPTKSETSVKMTVGSDTLTVLIDYESDQASFTPTPDQAFDEGADVNLPAPSIKNKAGNSITAGNITYHETLPRVTEAKQAQVGSSLSLGRLPAGSYTFAVDFAVQGVYAAAPTMSVKVTVKPKGMVTGIPAGTDSAPQIGKSLPLTLTGTAMNQQVACDGTITPSTGPALQLDASGKATYAVPAIAGQTGMQKVQFSYSGGQNCAANANAGTYNYQYANP